MSETSLPKPVDNLNRIISIDALRGFALAGVAIVHMVDQYYSGPQPDGYMEGVNSLPDQIVKGILEIFFRGKFFALFSILFGLSFFIQMDSANRKGQKFGTRFLWRATLLLLIGMVHQLFYRDDILTVYAVLAPLLLPFYSMSKKWLLIIAGLIFLGIPRFIAFILLGSEGVTGVHPMMDNNHELVKNYIDTIQNGSFMDVLSLNVTYGMLTKIDFQISLFGRFYYTFGYFLIGLWLGKTGIFRDLTAYNKQIKNVLLWSIGALIIAFILTAVTFATATQPMDFGSWTFVFGINFYDWVSIAMSSIILCGFLMLVQRDSWKKRLFFFAPYGRMALTNYVMQSVIGTFIFFNWGLGYVGHVRALYCFLLAIGVITIQTLFSKYWLNYFRFGPLEWLWRSGTYLKWQPLLKKNTEKATLA